MSKFIDKLGRLSRGEAQPMGFTARQPASAKPKMQLIARLAADEAESLSSRITGADAGLLNIAKANSAELLQKLAKGMSDIIWGGWLENSGPKEMERLGKAGADFIVFSAAKASVTVGKDNKELGKILEVGASLSDGLLRTINDLPVDAVLIPGDEKETQTVTWQHLMLYRRICGLQTKPLLVPVASQVTSTELEALWDAGVTAIVIEVSSKLPEDGLTKLRQEIDKTEFSSRRVKKADVLAPRIGLQSGRRPAREDEDDDD